MSATDDLRRRLGFVVQGIDAGTFRTPEAAADAILDVIRSVHPPHRAEAIAALVEMGVLETTERALHEGGPHDVGGYCPAFGCRPLFVAGEAPDAR